MNAKIVGEICFFLGLLIFAFFLWQHRKKKEKTVSWKEKKSSFFQEGIYCILHLMRGKKVFSMKKEQVDRLRKIYVGKEEEEIYYAHYGNMGKQIAMLLLFGFFLVSASSFIRQNRSLLEGYFLEREEADGKEKSLSIEADTGKEKKKVTVKIPNRRYSKEEQKEVIQEVKQRLAVEVLGENASMDEIRNPLHFPEGMKGYAVSIRWEIPLNGIIAADGSLKNSDLEEPVQTKIKAVITCGSVEEAWVKAVVIYPVRQEKQLSFWEKWQKAYQKSEEGSNTEKYVKLPEEVDGKHMKYTEEQISYPYVFLAVLFSLCLLVPVLTESRMKSRIQKRQEQLLLDYPEFMEHFVLLIGAGLNVKGTWERIVHEYEKRGEKKEKHFVYEEMAVTLRAMENGMNESKAYELFGKRTELLPYMKFCTMIIQNLKKGSADLLQLLEYEMVDSFHARKENAKALGEKAGTKLLMPMAVMLVIVFVLILYAAFQGM